MKLIHEIPELHYYLIQHVKEDKAFVFLNPPPKPILQRGECCKIYAARTVMQWLYETDPAHLQPPLVRKGDSHYYQQALSLRAQAKKNFGSKVGEMYNSQDLVNLAHKNGYDTSHLVEDEDHYIQSIMDCLHQGNAVIVFFDLDYLTWGPGLYQSKHEHAAVVFGYYHDKDNQLYFVSTYWNHYFYFKADALKKSAAQLALRRIPENFYKMNGEWYSDQGRHQLNHLNKLPFRKGEINTSISGTFRNKILIISASNTQNRISFACKESALKINKPLLLNKLNTELPASLIPKNNQVSYQIDTPEGKKTFLPLTKIITFFTLNIMQIPEQQLDKKIFEKFFVSADLNKEIDNFFQGFHPLYDDSLEGDIYNQTHNPARSIVEEVSNSIDANPEAIYCTIRDGYYEVREVNGEGITALNICTKYLLPKESTKIDSEKKIGLFGIGTFIKYGQLSNENDWIKVETRARNEQGYRIEFRLIDNCLCAALQQDSQIKNYGTITTVSASKIDAVNFQTFLQDSLSGDVTVPIYINDNRVTFKQEKKSVRIFKANILIQKISHPDVSFTTNITWHVSRAATIPENRDKVIVDNPIIVAELKNYIAGISQLSYPDWALHANTIAPLVIDLQATNTSLSAADNLFDFLLTVAREKLGGAPCIPDLPLYKPLQDTGVIPLHVSLLPKKWIEQIANIAPEWDNKGITIFTANMVYYPDNEPFIVDKDNNQLIIDTSYYQQIKNNNSIDWLTLIFSYPPNEINATRKNDTEKKRQESIEVHVDFMPEAVQNPLHALYVKHGMLSTLGDECTQQIINSCKEAYNILLKAKSLVTIHPAKAYNCYSPSEPNPSSLGALLAIKFSNQQYYYEFSSHQRLFDENFQLLSNRRYWPLKSKIQQYIDYHFIQSKNAFLDNIEITLTEKDMLLIYDRESKSSYICDGEGKCLFTDMSEKIVSVKLIVDEYYCCETWNKIYLFHRYQGLVTELDYNAGCRWRKLDCHENLIVSIYEGRIKSVFNLKTKKHLLRSCHNILINNNFFLGSAYENRFQNSCILQLCDLQGEVLYKFTHTTEVCYFHCEQMNENEIHFSLLNKYGQVHFFKVYQTKKAIYYKPKETIGFPVKALIINKQDASHLVPLSNEFSGPLEGYQFNKNYSNKGIDLEHYKSIPSLARLYPENLIVVKHQNCTCLLNRKTLLTTKLIGNIIADSIEEVQKKGKYFFILHRENGHSLVSIFNEAGELIRSGRTLDVYVTSNGDYFFQDGFVIAPSGKILNETPAQHVRVIHGPEGELIALYFSRDIRVDKDYQLYDKQDKRLHQDEKITSYDEIMHGVYSISNINKKMLFTKNAIIHNASPLSTAHQFLQFHTHKLVSVSRGKNAWFLTDTGYLLFNAAITDSPKLLRQGLFLVNPSEQIPYPALFQQLSFEQLKDPQILENLSYLNQLELNVFSYGECLRFIQWPLPALRAIIPYISLFSYTAKASKSDDYQIIIEFCEKLAPTNRELVLKTFNLILLAVGEYIEEPIAEKLKIMIEIYGINLLSEFYHTLKAKQHQLAFLSTPDAIRNVIDEMPVIVGQICYYLFFSERQLLTSQAFDRLAPQKECYTISLLDFMTAFYFDTRILDDIVDNPAAFINKVQDLTRKADLSHALRSLQHAIYHQACPNKNLYEREILQNALDAYAVMPLMGAQACIDMHLYREETHCVFRICNQAAGMSLKDIFYFYALIGTSSKRDDRHKHFIGGHGVGAFTIYANAKTVRLKSGKDGFTSYFEFHPIYSMKGKIIDITVRWEQHREDFQGVIIERVARGENPALDAARHQRTVKKHAKTVNANVATILLNEAVINRPLIAIASVELPSLGPMTLYSSIEDEITGSGLSIRPIGDVDQFIPEAIRKIVRKKGLIIDLPKQLRLNRERTELLDAKSVYSYLRPYLFQGYIHAYLHLFMKNHIGLGELPYDFFEYFEIFINDKMHNDPGMLEDAEKIRRNIPLSDYEQYASISRLHELLSFLPLFKVNTQKEIPASQAAHIQQECYSLIEIAGYYKQFKRFPDLEYIPLCLEFFVGQFTMKNSAVELQKTAAKQLNNFPEISWTQRIFTKNTQDWQLLITLSELLAHYMGYDDVTFALSTRKNGALLFTRAKSATIYWNIYAASMTLGSQLIKGLSLGHLSDDVLNKFIDVISHELTHAKLEEPCSSTHNNTFFLKQRKILINFSMAVSKDKLIKELIELYKLSFKKGANCSMTLSCRDLLHSTFFKDPASSLSISFSELFPTFNLSNNVDLEETQTQFSRPKR